MKRFLIYLLVLSSVTTSAQNNDNHDRKEHHDDNNRDNLPDNVRSSFQRDNPDVKDVHWQNSNGQWHSTYRDRDNHDADAYYDNDGRRIDTHYSYNETELPEGLRERLRRRNLSGYHAYRIDRPESGALFQITLGDGTISYYDENGRKRHYHDRH
jgi:hypothetical protein